MKEIKKVIVYQPGRFGDIFFVIPIVKRLIEKGYEVIYPLYKTRHTDIAEHFPEINMPILDPNHPMKPVWGNYVNVPNYPCILLPLWQGANWKISKGGYKEDQLMNCKYEMYNELFEDNLNKNTYWHNLTWKRFPEREQKLMNELGIKPGEKYILINEFYTWGKIPINVNTELRKIYFKTIPKYTMLDWGLVIENAEEIHCVDTAVLYIIDRLKTTDKLHRYRRIKEDVEIGHLFSKKYIKHKSNGEIESEI